jgi:hypothetical protein
MPYIFPPSKEVVTASKRAAIREAFMELLIKEKKQNISVKCGLRAFDQIMYMSEYSYAANPKIDGYLSIAGCSVVIVRDFDLDPWKIVYEGKVIYN